MSKYKLVPLCRCNNCMRVYEDLNPQDKAHRFEVLYNTPQLEKIDDMWACPKCETDMYLSDVGLFINIQEAYLSPDEEDQLPIIANILNWCDKGIRQSEDHPKIVDKKLFLHFKNIIFRTMKEYYDNRN